MEMLSKTSLPHVGYRLLWMASLTLLALLSIGGSAPAAHAQAFSTLHSFSYLLPDQGFYPYASLIQGKDGVLYGTTSDGGPPDSNGFFYGLVFRMNPDGSDYRVLHAFSNLGSDGAYPEGALLQGHDGALYGTTFRGGGANNVGIVYRVNPDGTGFTTLHAFDGNDGSFPEASVLQGDDGALYGTTLKGGGPDNLGTLFCLNPDGTGFRIVHTFSGIEGNTYMPVIQGQDGALYGTTYGDNFHNTGTVFRVNLDGSAFALLHVFHTSDGSTLSAPVMQGRDGALYGTASRDGGPGSIGTVYKVNTDGSGFQTLHHFRGNDGSFPEAPVIQGRDGALYGTTQGNNFNDKGTIFRLDTDGTGFQTLHFFNGYDGDSPFAAVLQGQDGALYGTTTGGGPYSSGTVFRLFLTSPLVRVTVTPLFVVGAQQNPIGNVLLSHLAPAGGIVVTLNSANTGAATVPATVTVPEGAEGAAFLIITKKVPSSVTVRLSATCNGLTQSTVLTVTPQIPQGVTLAALTVAPASVIGAQQNATGTVTLTEPAPTGGIVVTLTSANTGAATVPASITIPAGATSATFTVTTKRVPANVTTRLTATVNGSTQSTVLTVTH